jgi:hypothetical protein
MLLGGLGAYQRPQQGIQAGLPQSCHGRPPPETPNSEVGKFLEFQPVFGRQHLDHSINLDFLQQTA